MAPKQTFFAGIVNEDGTKIYMQSFDANSIDVLEWLTEEDKAKLLDDREPSDNPTLPSYIKVQPQNQGKIIWFSGPPGSGKSTTAQLLAKNNGYVYYEADCLSLFVNPYIDIHTPNPSMAQINQKPLKGMSKDLMRACNARADLEHIVEGGGDIDEETKKKVDDAFEEIGVLTGKEIKKQKDWIGGEWAIAFALFSRKQRDAVRKVFGPNLIFVVLTMSKECIFKRLAMRHGEEHVKDMDKVIDSFIKLYQKAEEDEEGAINVCVTEDMSQDDVVQEVLVAIKKM